ncbi:hypothetical protein [Stenotrophomonas sp.]|uniref:hypothetical protein n=1 Tax=Stenotrophomonas sp. TaxID=69392 RepID=UPI002FC7731A
MYRYDYTISLGVRHPSAASAEVASRLALERGFFRDVGTELRDDDGTLIRVHPFTWVLFNLSRGKDGWLMDAWPTVIPLLQSRAEAITALVQAGAEVDMRIGLFGHQHGTWAGFDLDHALVRLLADLRIRFQLETYFPDESDLPTADGTSPD